MSKKEEENRRELEEMHAEFVSYGEVRRRRTEEIMQHLWDWKNQVLAENMLCVADDIVEMEYIRMTEGK